MGEGDHLSPSRAEVNSAGGYTPTSPYAFMVCTRITLPLPDFIQNSMDVWNFPIVLCIIV
jgi:hypothetical protein